MECGRKFKKRGIKIHLAKSACGKKAAQRKHLEEGQEEVEEEKQQDLAATQTSHCSFKEQKSDGDPQPGRQPKCGGSPVGKEEKASELRILSPSIKKVDLEKSLVTGKNQPKVSGKRYKQQTLVFTRREKTEIEKEVCVPSAKVVQADKPVERYTQQPLVFTRGEKKKEVKHVSPAEEAEWRVLNEWKPHTEDELKLTSSEVANLRKLVLEGDEDEVLADHHHVVRRRDLATLHGREWLNDVVVNEYMEMIAEENEGVEVLSLFFFQQMQRYGVRGFEKTRRWIKKDWRRCSLILIPICNSHHYTLVCIKMGDATVHYLDSRVESRRGSKVPFIWKDYMERYCREQGDRRDFKVIVREDIPRQMNTVDCGVFLCHNAEREASGGRLDFSQESMPELRVKMIWEILNGRLQKSSRVVQEINTSVETRKIQQKAVASKKGKQKSGKSNIQKAGASNQESGHQKKKDDDPAQRKERVQWPKAASEEWRKLDTDLVPMLESLKGSPLHKMDTYPELVYKFCRERFGTEEKQDKKKTVGFSSRRQKRCQSLRQELNKLKEEYGAAGQEEDKKEINQRQSEVRRALMNERKAENVRKQRKKKQRRISQFTKNPYSEAKKILNDKVEGTLEDEKETVEQFLDKTHRDDRKDEDLVMEEMYQFPEPQVQFEMKEPTLQEIKELVKRTRTKSAPGPNGVPYKLYKYCPGVTRIMWRIFSGIWKCNKVPRSWREAEGCFIPKVDNAKSIDQFRTISFLNVEGKLYKGDLARKLTKFAVRNEYIDRSIQKAGIPGVSGCLENSALLTQMIAEAKKKKKNLVLTWLDIANAYGTMPHQLVLRALEEAHVPKEVQAWIKEYYRGVFIRFTTKQFTTTWQKLEKGIVTGCTLSVILFALSMTWLLRTTKEETKGPRMESGAVQCNARLYMDDIQTSTETAVQTKYLLERLGTILSSARLTVKATKSRSLVIYKGRVRKQDVKLKAETLTCLTEKPVKYLGKWFDESLNDKEQVCQIEKQLKTYLRRIDQSLLPGKYKVWCYQNVLLPKLMWPLSIYEVTLPKVESFQRLITGRIKGWLGIPKCLSVAALYSKSVKLQLPVSSVVEEVKVVKARNKVTLENSQDERIQKAGIDIKLGRKWNAAEEIDEALSHLQHQEISGIGNRGREGVGFTERKYYSKVNKKERRKLIVGKVRGKEEQQRMVKLSNLAKQSRLMHWEVEERRLKQEDLWKMNEVRLKFLVKSVYDLLPTPQNKNVWFNTDENTCSLCGGRGTLNHILCSCPVALSQGRYTYRHDKVLRVLAGLLDRVRIRSNASTQKKKTNISFVKEGHRGKEAGRSLKSYFDSSKDWKMLVDLGKPRLKVPEHIVVTTKRPDIVIYSNMSRQVLMVELTCPWEDRIGLANELKQKNYEDIRQESVQNGWRCQVWPVEIGARGFAGRSLGALMKEVGVVGAERKKIIKELSTAAEDGSRHIWSKHQVREWYTSN